MKVFEMIRNFDESGISGTGKVLEGAIFGNGATVVYWTASEFNSFGIYKNFYEFYQIHVKGHPKNNTEIIFDEDAMKTVKRERRKTCRHCKNTYEEHPRDKQWEVSGLRRSCTGNLVELENDTAKES
jgi:hypothetical protein